MRIKRSTKTNQKRNTSFDVVKHGSSIAVPDDPKPIKSTTENEVKAENTISKTVEKVD